MTDYPPDRQLDIETNEINVDDLIKKPVFRRKRDLVGHDVGLDNKNSTEVDKASKRSDHEEEIELADADSKSLNGDVDFQDDGERGKRQIRYYVKNDYDKPGKNWGSAKPVKYVNIPQFSYNPNLQNARYPSNFNGLSNNNFYDTNRNPFSFDDNLYAQTAGAYSSYHIDPESQRPFKPSLPDPFNQKYSHNPANIATQIITKSPPISALKNNENPFASLAGGFYNNAPKQIIASTPRPNQQVIFPDSSQVPSTIVTGKPVLIGSSPRPNDEYRTKPELETNSQQHVDHKLYRNGKEYNQQKQLSSKIPTKDEDYKDRDSSNEDEESNESSENYSSERDEEDDDFKHGYPEPPFEFTHPNNKYKDIENPFANPDFDFDAFLAKLSNGQYPVSTPKYKNVQLAALRIPNPTVVSTTAPQQEAAIRTSTINYRGMSSPKPFTGPFGPGSSPIPPEGLRQSEPPKPTGQWVQAPGSNQQSYVLQTEQQSLPQNTYRLPQQNAGIPLDAVRPSLKQPNFKDERQLPISHNFNRPESTPQPSFDRSKVNGNNQQFVSVSQKPYSIMSTGTPVIISTPKQQYLVKPEKIINIQPQVTRKPYLVSTIKTNNGYTVYKSSTAKPLTTIVNEQLSALQNYWKNPSTESHYLLQSTPRPNAVSENPKLQNFLSQTLRPSGIPVKGQIFANIAKNPLLSTTVVPPKRRPIPKPSPEMNDYYYDDEDDQYYYEPPVKSKYMPSSEVKPKRPPMAQNYKEYEDNYNYEDLQDRPISKPGHTSRTPTAFTTFRPETASKNFNDLSVVTKAPTKDYNKIIDGKIAIPVLIDYSTAKPTIVIRPEVPNYKIVHQFPRNRTMHLKKPILSTSGPLTQRPPKYLNQTTLRPYTVRHRLAKPTTVKEPVTVAPTRHPNIVTQTKFTTPLDNHNQESRFTKTKHDDKTNR